MSISVCIITFNEEANLPRTLASVRWADEIIVVDSGSTDRTCEIAREFGAKVFVEKWRGFAAQKNSALEKATCGWILSLDADEEVSAELAQKILNVIATSNPADGYLLPRRNLFLGRWMKHGGFYPDPKLRLWKRGLGHFEVRPVHENAIVKGVTATLDADLIHHAYPTLDGYIEHMNRYSSLGAELAVRKGQISGSLLAFLTNVLVRPQLTFLYNYILRLGFLDGREGLLLHLYHFSYVSWKYAKAWECARKTRFTQ
jgi:glycosyltransferase involved in cell wall biosynthesis